MIARKMLVKIACLIACFLVVFAAHDDITLENGGYGNLLVNIKDDVKYHKKIWDNLQDYFVEASEVLYKATKHDYDKGTLNSLRYFKEVTFFLPSSWRDRAPIQCNAAGTLNRNRAHFEVGLDTKQWDGIPHTDKQHAQCGHQQPNPIQLPEKFVKNDQWARSVFGQNLGKVLVHEFAIYRYGLHEESTAKDGESNCETVELPDGKTVDREVRCSTSINGVIKPGNKNKPCDFRHDSSSSPNARASLMFWGPEFLEQTETFCDDDPSLEHDFAVNHNHNRYCDVRTGWKVLRDHPDFNGINTGPVYDPDKNFREDIVFKCVCDAPVNRIALVMDASDSMKQKDRLTRMRQDVARFLDNLYFAAKEAGEEVEVGMAEFHEYAYITQYMTMLRTEGDLATLKDAIPSSTEWGTSIGGGLREGKNVLSIHGGSTVGAKIYVFTDGFETKQTPPTIMDMFDEIVQSQATVYSLLIDEHSTEHDLIKLSTATEGAWCVYSDDDGGIGYYECLNEIHALSSSHVPLEIKNEDYTVPNGRDVEDTVTVDSSFNEHLRFTLTWSNRFEEDVTEFNNNCNQVDLEVTSPEGHTIGNGDPGYEKNSLFQFIYITSRHHKHGEWNYKIINPSTKACSARLAVEGFNPRNTSSGDMDMPLMIEILTSTTHLKFDPVAGPLTNSIRLYVTLTKGNAPVLFANVEVHIEASEGEEWFLQLQDNGAGADLEKNDGIYSRFFYEFKNDGVYSLKFSAKGVDEQTKIKIEERVVEHDYFSFVVIKQEELLPYENFERSLVGTPFEVSGVPDDIEDIEEILPPAKISDLTVIGVSNTSVTLQWTAVGDSLDEGTAEHYDLRIARSSQQLRDNFDGCMEVTDRVLQAGTLKSPLPASSIETIDIDPQAFGVILNGTFLLSIKASDSHGNIGQMSNIASVHYTLAESSQPPAPSAIPPPGDIPGYIDEWKYITAFLCAVCLCGAVSATIIVGLRKREKVHAAVV